MRISIHNAQRRFKLDTVALKRLAAALAELAQTQCGRRHAASGRGSPSADPWREVTVHLLDDAGIAPVNAAIMAHGGSTDVITQRYDPIPGEPGGLTGELFVNVERAARAVRRRGTWSDDRELALYLAHGFDHLTGADDGTQAGRSRMRRRELGWLKLVALTPLFQTGKL